MTIAHQPAMQGSAIRQRRPGGRVVVRRPVARKPVLIRLGVLIAGTAVGVGVALTIVIAAVFVFAGALAG
jgi:hypothetical protein